MTFAIGANSGEPLPTSPNFARVRGVPKDTTPSNKALTLNPYALTAWREERGLTKTELAGAAQIGLGYLCDLEKGRRPGSAQVIRRLADAMKVNVLVLVENPNDQAVA